MRELEPAIVVEVAEGTQKKVRVRPIDFGGFYAVLEAIDRAKLQAPNLMGDALAKAMEDGTQDMQDAVAQDATVEQMLAMQTAARMRTNAALARMLSENVDAIWNWLMRSHPVVCAVLVAGTNLSKDELRGLELAQTIRLVREIWNELKNSGLMKELADFFPASPNPEPAVPPAENPAVEP